MSDVSSGLPSLTCSIFSTVPAQPTNRLQQSAGRRAAQPDVELQIRVLIFDVKSQKHWKPLEYQILTLAPLMRERDGSRTAGGRWGQGERYVKSMNDVLLACGVRTELSSGMLDVGTHVRAQFLLTLLDSVCCGFQATVLKDGLNVLCCP